MTAYESHIAAAENLNVNIIEMPINGKGYCYNNYIFIRSDLSEIEKNCILAEEIAHYLYTSGDITDQNNITNRKVELFARRKAYLDLIPFENVLSLLRAGEPLYDIADLYNVTEEFLHDALEWYISKYGVNK